MPRFRAFLMRHEAGAYFALAFALSWAAVLAVAWPHGLRASAAQAAALGPAVYLAMLTGPVGASLLLIALLQGPDGFRALAQRLRRRVGPRWGIALLLAPALLLAILVPLSWLDPRFAPAVLAGGGRIPWLAAIAAGLGAGLFEELGWTGFATPALRRHHGVLGTGLGLGLLWALWHGLADWWGGASYGPLWSLHFLEWVVALTSYRLVMTWVYEQTGSLLLAQLMHAAFTGSQALLWPSAPPVMELVWYGLFAAALAFAAGLVVARERPLAPGWRAPRFT